MELKLLRRDLDKKIAARKHAWMTIQDELKKVEASEEHHKNSCQAQEHLQLLAQEVQAQAHKDIARIVTRCLETVFDDPYELQIEFNRARGKTEARLVYLKDGNEVNPLVTSGGVLDISALALRVANMILSSPQPRKLLILDEPCTGVSAKNLPKVVSLIMTLAREMKIQFLIVTHNPAFEVGKVVQI